MHRDRKTRAFTAAKPVFKSITRYRLAACSWAPTPPANAHDDVTHAPGLSNLGTTQGERLIRGFVPLTTNGGQSPTLSASVATTTSKAAISTPWSDLVTTNVNRSPASAGREAPEESAHRRRANVLGTFRAHAYTTTARQHMTRNKGALLGGLHISAKRHPRRVLILDTPGGAADLRRRDCASGLSGQHSLQRL
jgi:hypothetical protein